MTSLRRAEIRVRMSWLVQYRPAVGIERALLRGEHIVQRDVGQIPLRLRGGEVELRLVKLL